MNHNYIIFDQTGKQVNRIHGSEQFVAQYCNVYGYSFDMDVDNLPPEDSLITNTKKRRLACSAGEVSGVDYRVMWDGRQYTIDELTQIGVQHAFRGEVETATAIKTVVVAEFNRVLEAFPNENDGWSTDPTEHAPTIEGRVSAVEEAVDILLNGETEPPAEEEADDGQS